MKHAFALFAAAVLGGQTAFAADIFVRNARGSDLSQQQTTDVTNHVKNAVRNMPEHTLVMSEEQADFVLAPTLVQRGDEMVLRIEKSKDGSMISMAEEPIGSISASRDGALAVTETALQDDQYVADTAESDEAGSMSASSESASGMSMAQNESSQSQSGLDEGTVSGATEDTATAGVGGDVRAPSPRLQDPNRLGYFQIGVGPTFALGLDADQLMYNINAAYALDFSEVLTGKIMGDFNLGTGGDAARFINVGIGAEYYPIQETFAGAKPYVMADIGYAFTRHNDQTQRDAPAVGAGAGFKFAAADLNFDANLHYTILTSQIRDDNPSVLGVRLAVNF